MQNNIVIFILERKYWQKAQGVPKSRWRENISREWTDYKKKNNISATAEEFCEAWLAVFKK